jgi:hypothetical protein
VLVFELCPRVGRIERRQPEPRHKHCQKLAAALVRQKCATFEDYCPNSAKSMIAASSSPINKHPIPELGANGATGKSNVVMKSPLDRLPGVHDIACQWVPIKCIGAKVSAIVFMLAQIQRDGLREPPLVRTSTVRTSSEVKPWSSRNAALASQHCRGRAQY